MGVTEEAPAGSLGTSSERNDNDRTTSLADAALARALGAPRPRNPYTVESTGVPMRDGVVLVADHLTPATSAPQVGLPTRS